MLERLGFSSRGAVRPLTRNPYLEGNYAPFRRETETPRLTLVHGQIPPELKGCYYRTGPAPRFDPIDPNLYHWFDGDGMIEAFHFDGEKVSHKNRWVRTEKLLHEERAGRALFGGIRDFRRSTSIEGFEALGLRKAELIEMKVKGLLGKPPTSDQMRRLRRASDRSNTNIVHMAGKLLSLIESAAAYEMDPDSLATRGRVTFGDTFVTRSMSAHPKIDVETGTIYTFSYEPMPPYLRYYVITKEGRVTLSRDIDVPYPSMMHDFSVTETKAVFYQLPAVFDLRETSDAGPIRWRPSFGSSIGVTSRDDPSAPVRWFELEPFFLYHPMNAFDDGDALVLDVVRYPRLALFDTGGESPNAPLSENPEGKLTRIRIDLASGKVTTTLLDDHPSEFPIVDPRRALRPYRYGWTACRLGLVDDRGAFNAVSLYDHKEGKARYHDFGPTSFTLEPIFAPKSPDSPEGEGFLLTLVYRADEDKSDLVILDALQIEREPVAVLRCPRRIPYGFHGTWVSSQLRETP